MRFSIESRVPFLDHHLVELGMSLPVSHRVRRGVRKSVLRHAVPELPRSVQERRDKMGFVAPDAEYATANPRDVRDVVLDAAQSLERLVDATQVENRFAEFSKGQRPFDRFFYRLAALDGWRRGFGMSLN